MATAAPRLLRLAIDPRSRVVYSLIAVAAVLDLIALPCAGLTISPWLVAGMVGSPLFIVFGSWVARGAGFELIAGPLETITLVIWQGIVTLPLLISLAKVGAPFADAKLAAADRALGFDWQTTVIPLSGHTHALYALILTYHSFAWQPALVLGALFLSRRSDRAWQFVTAVTIALGITTAIFPFLPALGAFHYYGITPSQFRMDGNGPWQFGDVLLTIRRGATEITPDLFSGLVSFPSYHAAAAMLFVWALWPIRAARAPMVALNVILCFAALVFGAHYLVDLLGGVAVAAASVFITRAATTAPR